MIVVYLLQTLLGQVQPLTAPTENKQELKVGKGKKNIHSRRLDLHFFAFVATQFCARLIQAFALWLIRITCANPSTNQMHVKNQSPLGNRVFPRFRKFASFYFEFSSAG